MVIKKQFCPSPSHLFGSSVSQNNQRTQVKKSKSVDSVVQRHQRYTQSCHTAPSIPQHLAACSKHRTSYCSQGLMQSIYGSYQVQLPRTISGVPTHRRQTGAVKLLSKYHVENLISSWTKLQQDQFPARKHGTAPSPRFLNFDIRYIDEQPRPR